MLEEQHMEMAKEIPLESSSNESIRTSLLTSASSIPIKNIELVLPVETSFSPLLFAAESDVPFPNRKRCETEVQE